VILAAHHPSALAGIITKSVRLHVYNNPNELSEQSVSSVQSAKYDKKRVKKAEAEAMALNNGLACSRPNVKAALLTQNVVF